MKNSPSKNIIWKSFETFVTQPISLLCNKIIRVVNVKSELLAAGGINADITGDAIQVNVVNSDGAYNLLAAVAYKKKMQALKRGSYGGTLALGTLSSAATSPFGAFDSAGAISTRNAIIENKKRTIFN